MTRMVTLVEIPQKVMKSLIPTAEAFGVEPLELWVHAMNFKYQLERERLERGN